MHWGYRHLSLPQTLIPFVVHKRTTWKEKCYENPRRFLFTFMSYFYNYHRKWIVNVCTTNNCINNDCAKETINNDPCTFYNSQFQEQNAWQLQEVELVNFLAIRLSRKEAIQTYVSSLAPWHLKSLNSWQRESLLLGMDISGLGGMRRKWRGKRKHHRCFLDLFNLSIANFFD